MIESGNSISACNCQLKCELQVINGKRTESKHYQTRKFIFTLATRKVHREKCTKLVSNVKYTHRKAEKKTNQTKNTLQINELSFESIRFFISSYNNLMILSITFDRRKLLMFSDCCYRSSNVLKNIK